MRIWAVLIIIFFSNPALGEESLRITSYALKADNNIIVAAQKLRHTTDFKTGLFLVNSKTKSITKINLNPSGYMREISHIIPVNNQIYLISQLSIGGGDTPIMEKLSPDGSLEKLHSFDECASVKRVSLKRDYVTLYCDENVREKIYLRDLKEPTSQYNIRYANRDDYFRDKLIVSSEKKTSFVIDAKSFSFH